MNKIKYIDQRPYTHSSSVCMYYRALDNSHVKFLVKWLDGEKIVYVKKIKGQSYKVSFLIPKKKDFASYG